MQIISGKTSMALVLSYLQIKAEKLAGDQIWPDFVQSCKFWFSVFDFTSSSQDSNESKYRQLVWSTGNLLVQMSDFHLQALNYAA